MQKISPFIPSNYKFHKYSRGLCHFWAVLDILNAVIQILDPETIVFAGVVVLWADLSAAIETGGALAMGALHMNNASAQVNLALSIQVAPPVVDVTGPCLFILK